MSTLPFYAPHTAVSPKDVLPLVADVFYYQSCTNLCPNHLLHNWLKKSYCYCDAGAQEIVKLKGKKNTTLLRSILYHLLKWL